MIIVSVVGVAIALAQVFLAFAVHRLSKREFGTKTTIQRVVPIHEWGDKCIEALAEAEHFCLLEASSFETTGSYAIRKNAVLQRLSALVDQGRLFFKNTCRDKIGRDKFPARRGYRPELLDPLVAAYRAVEGLGVAPDRGRFDRLYKWRGRFVSLLQYEVDPDWLQLPSPRLGPGADTGVSISAATEPQAWPEERALL